MGGDNDSRSIALLRRRCRIKPTSAKTIWPRAKRSYVVALSSGCAGSRICRPVIYRSSQHRDADIPLCFFALSARNISPKQGRAGLMWCPKQLIGLYSLDAPLRSGVWGGVPSENFSTINVKITYFQHFCKLKMVFLPRNAL